MSADLKYPRRTKRSINGTSYKIAPPDDTRSRTMSRVKSRGTSIEKIIASTLRKSKMKYRSGKNLFGKPDFRLLGYKVAIFCDGDFWHGYKLDQRSFKKNADFWLAKIKRNIARDKEVNRELRKQGWKIFRFWEHDIKKKPDACIKRIRNYLDEINSKGE